MKKKTEKKIKAAAKKRKPSGSSKVKKIAPADRKELLKFLVYVRDKHLDELARENMKNSKEMALPLLKLFEHLPDKVLLEQSKQGVVQFIEDLKAGTYIEKQKHNLHLWEHDKLSGISRDSISPTDLVLAYSIQKKGYYKFLPAYTKDSKLAVKILGQLEQLHLASQVDATNLLFKISKQSAEKMKRTVEMLSESEERLRQITQNVKDYAIYMIDIHGKVLSWGKGAEKLKGYKPEEIIGKNIEVFYTPDDVANGTNIYNLEEALEKGRCETEGWRMRKDRSMFWANVLFSPIYGDDGTMKGFAKIVRDLTERKKAEEQLRRTNSFLDSVLENIPNMVFVKEAKDLRFVRFNKAGEKLLGVSQNDMIGKNDYDFFPKDQADFFIAKDMVALKGDGVVDVPEELMDTKDGQRWLHTRKIPIKDADGKPIYLLGISEDITQKRAHDEEVRTLNAELKQNVKELESVNKELDAFCYSVSHDLRAPLRAIHGYSKILNDDYGKALNSDARSMLDAVMNNTVRMGQLIDDLLAFSRLGKTQINVMDLNMTDVAKQALDVIKEATPGMLKTSIVLDELLPVKADHNLMGQVFYNLVSNAIKYSEKTYKPLVEIGSYKHDGEHVYFVKDNGVGFDMKYYNKLFGVFQRLHSNTEFEGTGVGLALVKRIVTRHGGRVWAEAAPGKGATFYVALKAK